jgi:hypothetical protein
VCCEWEAVAKRLETHNYVAAEWWHKLLLVLCLQLVRCCHHRPHWWLAALLTCVLHHRTVCSVWEHGISRYSDETTGWTTTLQVHEIFSLHNLQTSLLGPTPVLLLPGSLYPESKLPYREELTTHLHLMARLGIHAVIFYSSIWFHGMVHWARGQNYLSLHDVTIRSGSYWLATKLRVVVSYHPLQISFFNMFMIQQKETVILSIALAWVVTYRVTARRPSTSRSITMVYKLLNLKVCHSRCVRTIIQSI